MKNLLITIILCGLLACTKEQPQMPSLEGSMYSGTNIVLESIYKARTTVEIQFITQNSCIETEYIQGGWLAGTYTHSGIYEIKGNTVTWITDGAEAHAEINGSTLVQSSPMGIITYYKK